MKCDRVYLHICDNLDENLNSPRCREIKAHLRECPDCRAYLDSLKKTITLYRAMPEPSVPARAHRRLLKTLTTLEGRPDRNTRPGRRKT
jgi:anti-sigma factor RsiW